MVTCRERGFGPFLFVTANPVNGALCASGQQAMAIMIFAHKIHEQNNASILYDDGHPTNQCNEAIFPPSTALEENSIAIFPGRWRKGSRHPTSISGGLNQRDEDETGFEIGCTRLGVNGAGLCCDGDPGFGWRVL
jgi:hypothetical protein